MQFWALHVRCWLAQFSQLSDCCWLTKNHCLCFSCISVISRYIFLVLCLYVELQPEFPHILVICLHVEQWKECSHIGNKYPLGTTMTALHIFILTEANTHCLRIKVAAQHLWITGSARWCKIFAFVFLLSSSCVCVCVCVCVCLHACVHVRACTHAVCTHACGGEIHAFMQAYLLVCMYTCMLVCECF